MKKKSFPTFIKMLKKVNESDEGFTLIDMMVTLSLFALLTTVLISSYPDSATKVELANAVSDVQGVVRDSQLRAGTIDSSTDGTTGGYGLYFDPATTTSFFQFKDTVTATSTNPTLLSGNNLFDGVSELAKTVTIPVGFYLRNICVANSSARPFPTATCTRTNPSLGTVSVVFNKMSSQPYIYVGNSTTTRYLAACAEFASVKSVGQGKVKSIIISQSGFSTTSLGACDEVPVNLSLNTGDGPGGLSGILTGNVSDRTPPVISLLGGDFWSNHDITIAQNAAFTDPGATAFDNIDGDISTKISGGVDSITTSVTQNAVYFSVSTSTGETIRASAVNRVGEVFIVTSQRIGKVALNGTFTKYIDIPPTPVGQLSMTVDASGNVYTANYGSNNVTKITAAGVSSTLGTTGTNPTAITIDASGNVYTANYGSNNVTKITAGGVSSTLGTTGTNPRAITLDASGNVYTANYGSSNVTKITPAGVSSTLGSVGAYSIPEAITVDASGNVYTANSSNSANSATNDVTKITPSGVSSTLGTTSATTPPAGILVDFFGNVYVANYGSKIITKITQGGVSSVYATAAQTINGFSFGSYGKIVVGTDSLQNFEKVVSSSTSRTSTVNTSVLGRYVKHYTVNDATGNKTTVFRNITVVGSGPDTTPPVLTLNGASLIEIFSGTSYTEPGATAVDETDGDITSRITSGIDSVTSTSTQQVTLYATSMGETITDISSVNGAGEVSVNTTTRLGKVGPDGVFTKYKDVSLNPNAIALDASGYVYTANYGSNNVTKITASGVSSTLGTTGAYPIAITLDASGNVYTANYNANNVTKITAAGVSSTLGTTGTNPMAITVDASGNVYTANAGSNNVTKITPGGVSSTLGTTGGYPRAIVLDASGNFYTANNGSNNVTKITPAGVSNMLGTTGIQPIAIAIDASGNVYTANNGSNNVTKITAAGVSRTLGTTGISPTAITVDASGNVYTANYGSNNVTKITSAGVSRTFGTIGDYPMAITIDASGNVYTANTGSNNVTKITAAGVSSTFERLNFASDYPHNMTFDNASNLYVVISSTNDVTKITPAGVSSVFATTGSVPAAIVYDRSSGNFYTANYNANNVTKITAGGASSTLGTTGSAPRDIAVDASGNVYTANLISNNVTKITPAGVSSTLGTTGANPRAIALDASGNVYTANYNVNNVTKITAGGVSSTLGTTGTKPTAITVDASGNVYTVDGVLNNSITKITPGGVSSVFASFGSGLVEIFFGSYGKIAAMQNSIQNLEKTTVTTVATTTLNTNSIGAYLKHYTASDLAGNIGIIFRTILVK